MKPCGLIIGVKDLCYPYIICLPRKIMQLYLDKTFGYPTIGFFSSLIAQNINVIMHKTLSWFIVCEFSRSLHTCQETSCHLWKHHCWSMLNMSSQLYFLYA